MNSGKAAARPSNRLAQNAKQMQTATPLPLRAVRQINSIPTAKSERAYRHRESHAMVDPVPNRPNFVAALEHLRESDPLFSQRLSAMRASRDDRSPGHAPSQIDSSRI